MVRRREAQAACVRADGHERSCASHEFAAPAQVDRESGADDGAVKRLSSRNVRCRWAERAMFGFRNSFSAKRPSLGSAIRNSQLTESAWKFIFVTNRHWTSLTNRTVSGRTDGAQALDPGALFVLAVIRRSFRTAVRDNGRRAARMDFPWS